MSTFTMIVKMSAMTFLCVLLTFILWKQFRDRRMTLFNRVLIGVVFGSFSVLSTHFGVDYGTMVLNVRDLGPMSAGLFFDPVSGIIAGIIGGAERYIAGTYRNIGSFTTIACSVSTCLAGFLAAFLNVFIFKGKKPSTAYAFFMGTFIEVFHMYAVFVTHRDTMDMALNIVKVCSIPMILFSGMGLAISATAIGISLKEWRNPFRRLPGEMVPVTHRFQVWLFVVTGVMLYAGFFFNFTMQTHAALQDANDDISFASADIMETYKAVGSGGGDVSGLYFPIGSGEGFFVILDQSGNYIAGTEPDGDFGAAFRDCAMTGEKGITVEAEFNGTECLCRSDELYDGSVLFIAIPMSAVYSSRDAQAYETMLADILLFTVIYVMISMLVQMLVADNLALVNKSLHKITGGDLDEKVEVFKSSEFASLSNDINEMVTSLKQYISEAEKRIEQELLLAHTIQESALPRNFDFQHPGFKVFAMMDPAREVGGDFYDFFFVDTNKVALVIADVSGKGVPASLFMMRSKTAIRSLAETGKDLTEVFATVNKELYTGNEAEMFVTVWMGIANLETGVVRCINAGHEYPAIMHPGGRYELFKEKHCPPLGVIEDLKLREYEIKLEPESKIFVYTDGVPEATDKDDQLFSTDRMLDALNSYTEADPAKTLENVMDHLDVFVGDAEQFDDITMLSFEYKGSGTDEERPVTGMREIEIDAVVENLPVVTDLIEKSLEPTECSFKTRNEIIISVEEIFVNIAHYAYETYTGKAIVRSEVSDDLQRITITFIDHGVPYDPTANEDPDVTLPASERKIGGLGIYMTKKLMDDVVYDYAEGKNILTLSKQLIRG